MHACGGLTSDNNPQECYAPPLAEGFLLVKSSPVRLDCILENSRDPPVSTSLVPQACTTLDLFWVLRIELRSLCLSSKHLTNGASLFPSQQVLFQDLCVKVSFVFTKIMKRLCKINSLFFLFSIFDSLLKLSLLSY